MNIRHMEARNIGPISNARIEFGDLTTFVGPQATGKSILLQLLKLVADGGVILAELKRQGLDWGKRLPRFLDIYLGAGMGSVWHDAESSLKVNGDLFDERRLIHRRAGGRESLFFI